MKECIEWFFSMIGKWWGKGEKREKGEKGEKEKVVWFIGDEIFKLN